MQIEEIQGVVSSIASLTTIVVPVWVVSAILCFAFRRSPWITGVWTFTALPAVLFFAMLVRMLSLTNGAGPDGGFVGMGTMFTLAFCVFEIGAGLLLLCSIPPPGTWSRRPALIAIPAGLLSIGGIGWGVHIATVPPANEAAAIALVRALAPMTDDTIKASFRSRAFAALLRNPNTSPRVLQEAATDLKSNSRYWADLAYNPSLPTSVVDSKLHDPVLGPVFAMRHSPGVTGSDPRAGAAIKSVEPMSQVNLHVYIPCDGTLRTFNLVTGHGAGDLHVMLSRTPINIDRGKPFDWTLTVGITNGGIMEDHDVYPYEAPAAGYSPTWTLTMHAGDKAWSSDVAQNFYFETDHGRGFGRMTIQVTANFQPPPTLFDAEIYFNPTASRNLKFDPSKTLSMEP